MYVIIAREERFYLYKQAESGGPEGEPLGDYATRSEAIEARNRFEEVEEENPLLTLGELYGLAEDDPEFAVEALLSTKQRAKLPDSAFCGPDRSFPAHDKDHVTQGLRLVTRYKGPGDKDAIRACLMRKGKKLGMTFANDKKKEYAVWCSDTAHAVGFGLYPLPTSEEELTTVLSHVQAMPHTPEEQEGILDALYRASEKFLPVAKLAEMFGTHKPCETCEQETVEISLTTENYGLLYSAVQYAPGSRGPVVLWTKSEKNGDTESEDQTADTPVTPTESATPDVPPENPSPQNGLLDQLEALRVQFTVLEELAKNPPLVPATEPALPSPPPAATEAETRLQESEQCAKKAVASSVALHMRTLRKPQARDKSQEALITELMEKSFEVLQDRLDTLVDEASSATISGPKTLPSIPDPTEASHTDPKNPTTDPEKLKNEIEESEDDPIQVIEDDNSALGELFKELRIRD